MFSLFGTRYEDEQIAQQAEQAVVYAPLLSSMTDLDVTSQDGVVTVRGTVNSEREKEHVVKLVQQALEGNGLKFERIVDEVTLRSPTSESGVP